MKLISVQAVEDWFTHAVDIGDTTTILIQL